MCGRYSLTDNELKPLEEAFHKELPSVEARYNIAPSQVNPVVYQAEDGIQLGQFRWGLVPHWSMRPETKYSTINARVEKVAQSPAYRYAYKKRHCLVPVSGWYEWRKGESGKQPYYIYQRETFAFAGLWEYWAGGGAEPFHSYTIMTGPAAETIQHIHPRMPLVLPASAWQDWLNPDSSQETVEECLASPVTNFEAYPISTRVNSPRNDGPELIQPLYSK